MFFTALVVPCTTLPKLTPGAESAADTTPLPESVASTGPAEELSITVIWPPEVAPVAVGVKITPITQLEFAARLPLTVPPAMGQVVLALVSSEKGPPKTSCVMESTLLWLFLRVSVLVALAVFTTTLPKARAPGLSVVAAIPLPDTVMLCGLLLAFVVMVTAPAGTAPAAVGVNVMAITPLAPPASDPGLGQVVEGSSA